MTVVAQPERKGDRRAEAILDALESLLEEGPIAKATIGRIATRAGVGRTAFYFYFSSREAALAALAARSVEPVYRAAEGWLRADDDGPDSLRVAIEHAVDTWIAQTHLFCALVEAAAADDAMDLLWRRELDGLIGAVAQRIEFDARAGRTWPGIDPRATAEALGWMTERCLYVYLGERGEARERAAVVAMLSDVWLRSIYPPPVVPARRRGV